MKINDRAARVFRARRQLRAAALLLLLAAGIGIASWLGYQCGHRLTAEGRSPQTLAPTDWLPSN